MVLPCLFVASSLGMGRGVFTLEDIEAKTIIEVSPVIVMSSEDRLHLDKTLLHDYIFEWGDARDLCAMALGFIPIYNHSYKSNCEYTMNFDEKLIIIQSVQFIKAGEELFINYNGDWNDSKLLWFDAK